MKPGLIQSEFEAFCKWTPRYQLPPPPPPPPPPEQPPLKPLPLPELGGADESPAEMQAELVGRERAQAHDPDAQAAPPAAGEGRVGREQAARHRVRDDLALGLLQRGAKLPLELGDLDLLAAGEQPVQ